MSKRNKVLVGSGAVALIAILVVVSAGARRDRGVEVRFEKVAKRDLVAAVTASGKIQPKKKVDISADITEANLNAAEHQVDQSRAAVQEARDNLRKTHITAPMAGRVTRLAVEEGEVAVPGTFSKDVGLLLTVSELAVIEAKVRVDEPGVVRVHVGGSGEVSIDAFPDTTFTGRGTKISNSSILTATSTATGQNERAVDYEVEITLNHPPADVRPDLSATARVVTDTRKQVLSIPIIALTVRENKPISTENRPADTSAFARKKREAEGVFIVTNGVAAFRTVKVGIAGDEYFEVADGVKQGETIVAGPYQSIRDLKDSARVRPMKQAADSAKKKE